VAEMIKGLKNKPFSRIVFNKVGLNQNKLGNSLHLETDYLYHYDT